MQTVSHSPQTAGQTNATPAGSATGSIHFERTPGATAAGKSASLELTVRAGLGVWQPGRHRLRVVLLDTSPHAAQTARWLAAATSDGAMEREPYTHAVLELAFIPTAQAFDLNDLDSATLTVINSNGLSSTADVRGSLTWTGSLPAPQASATEASAATTIELTSSGNAVSADHETWRQAWQLSVSVPVVLHE
jgi:hypothetical protein